MSDETTESTEIPETPEDAAEAAQAPPAPEPVGTLTEEELHLLSTLQHASHQTVMRIGRLEVEKAELLRSMGMAEARAQEVMNKAAERFGVQPNQRWTVNPDGKVFVFGG